ncbi:MAG TPA: Gfo/Idh/MocA family oxidoreductase [Limnochordia bacterium]|nr:Gfo/Idh/MocA family oxidoreductase [Limnochordia bacterium]
MKTYRVGIVGCRARGTAAALAYTAHPRTEVVALCDLLPERLAALGEQIGVSAHFHDLDQMIERARPDIVVIATGTEFHYPLAMQALAHGVHLDIEKPLSVDLAQADTLLAEADRRGVRIAVHHQQRPGPSFQAVARALRAGRIGELRYMQASDKGYYGGYGLMNIGTHLINAMFELAGAPQQVSATALTRGRPITPADVHLSPGGMGTIAGEHITATFAFAGGATGTLLLHRFPRIDKRAFHIEVLGSEGRLFWTGPAAWFLPAPHPLPGAELGDWTPLAVDPPAHFQPGSCAIDDFAYVAEYVDALDAGREHVCGGHEGRRVLEAMMGIFEAAAYGRAVALPQADRSHPLLRWRSEAGLGPLEQKPRAYEAWMVAEGFPAPERERPNKRAQAAG